MIFKIFFHNMEKSIGNFTKYRIRNLYITDLIELSYFSDIPLKKIILKISGEIIF